MTETISVSDITAIELRNRTRRAANTIYHVVSERPESDIVWKENEPTATHSPETHETVFTTRILPPEARTRPFLAMLLLQGAAAHEAAHHRTLETFLVMDLMGFFNKQPENLPGPEWREYASQMRSTIYRLTEDIHCNDWLSLRWSETYWRSTQAVIRYLRNSWIENLLWQVRWYELAAEVGTEAGTGQKAINSALLGAAGSSHAARDKLRTEYIDAGGNPDDAEHLGRHSVIDTLTSAFQVWFVYRPSPAEIQAHPELDLTGPLTKLWALMDKADPTIRAPWPATAEAFLEATDSMKREARRRIGTLLASGLGQPVKAVDIYRDLTTRYFAEIFDFSKLAKSKDKNLVKDMGNLTSGEQEQVSPEGGQGPPSGTTKTRDTAEREERRLRKERASQGDDAANDAEEDMEGGPDPFKVIRDYIQKRPGSVGAQSLRPVVDELEAILRGK